ncbi:MAG: nicotinate-nucleotide adenylyltransferase [Dehalococcoidales bacterium]
MMSGSGRTIKIGVLGGTFDPPHNGHITIAEEVMAQLGLTEVYFVPVGLPWLKDNLSISPAIHRIQMIRLAIADKPCWKLAALEVGRSGPSFTVDTIIELQAQLGAGDELFFILGWDNLSQLPLWREPSRLIQACTLVAVRRPGYSLPDLDSLEEAIPGLTKRLIVLDKPEIDISSTEIRQRVAQGLPIRHLVPEPVAAYIEEKGLYSDKAV